MADYQTIELPKELREKVYPEILNWCRQSMEGNSERNEILRSYRDLADGLTQTQNPDLSEPSMVDDPMTMEHVIGNTAHQMGALRYEPYWLIEPEDPKDSESARKLEQGLAVKSRLWNVRERLYDSRYNANRFPFSVSYTSWEQETQKRRRLVYRGSDGSEVRSEEEMRDGVTYTPVPVVAYEKGYHGPRIRTIEPENFLLYPSNAQDIDLAIGIGDIMYLTVSDLLLGERDLGYETESISKMLEGGPNWTGEDTKTEQDERDGVEDTGEARFYQCIQFICRLPELLDEEGRPELPKHLLGEDFLFMVCPDYECVFKCEPYAYDMRTYTLWNMLRVPGRIMGKCVPQMLESLQVELNGLLQYRFSLMNYHAAPVLIAPRKMKSELLGKRIKPGLMLFRDNPADQFDTLHWPMEGVQFLIQGSAELRQRATELMSAEGVDNLPAQGEPPTATQANIVAGGVAAKRDLYQQCLQEGDERLGLILVSLWLQHMNPEGETIQAEGQTIDITSDDLEKRYRLVAHSNTDDANPRARLEKMMALAQYIRSTPTYQMKTQTGDMGMDYHINRRVLEAFGERDIEGWIGQEPEQGSPEEMLSKITMMLQQAAQAGDPAAQQILQMLAQGQPQAQGPQQIPAQANGAGPMPQEMVA